MQRARKKYEYIFGFYLFICICLFDFIRNPLISFVKEISVIAVFTTSCHYPRKNTFFLTK